MHKILLLFLCSLSSFYGQSVFVPFSKYPPAKDSGWYYPQAIVALSEPSIFESSPDVDVYRFFDCTWDRPCVMARIVKGKSKATLTGIQIGGSGGYNMAGAASVSTRDLTAKEWETISDLLQKSKFWTMSHYIERNGIDGYDYILEARVGGKYHYVVRWVPDDYPEDKAFANLVAWVSKRVKRVGSVEIGSGFGLVTDKGFPVTLGK